MKKTNCGIYRIVNLIPNKITGIHKCYIGSSENLKSRKWQHFYDLSKNKHINNHLQSAVKIYGIENFKFEVVVYIEKIEDKKKLREALLEYENLELLKYKNEDDGTIDHDKCYNIRIKAESNLGFKHSKESRKLMGASQKGRKHSEETIEKMKSSHKGKKHSQQTKKKMSKASIKKYSSKFTPEHRKKLSEAKKGKEPPNKGKIMTEEQKNKISSVMKGRKLSEDHKNKIKQSNSSMSDITKQKMSESAKKRPPISEETRNKLRESKLGSNNPNFGKSKINIEDN